MTIALTNTTANIIAITGLIIDNVSRLLLKILIKLIFTKSVLMKAVSRYPPIIKSLLKLL